MRPEKIPFNGKSIVVFVFILVSIAACDPDPGQDPAPRYTANSSKSFDDVLADLEFAIGEHNFRLTGRDTIGEAIAAREDIDMPPATVLHFCNLAYARQFLEVAPQYLLHMPCRIALYEQGGNVTVEARLLPENEPAMRALSQKINRILKMIVSSAVE
ncbi:MAG: DUF302 domain-containing protein [Gammaproteobacteria bacterium]|nr:MAG: DUF302 domain-containing protein [Gammaproteobacteria bacterium]